MAKTLKKKTVSDKDAKQKCINYLQTQGYYDLQVAKRKEGCDLIGFKNNEKYYFEVKYSTKESGKFFGCVMLTEMYTAIKNDKHYKFIICRANPSDENDWYFKIFEVEEFFSICSLSTPILHYHIYLDNDNNLVLPQFSKNTILASPQLIIEMWDDFNKWKNKNEKTISNNSS